MGNSIHPSVNDGVQQGSGNFTHGSLQCHCTHDPVIVTVQSDVLHNHACGCTKCWKPVDAMFSVVGVVPREQVQVVENEAKLGVVDESAMIQRHACKECGVHLFGRIERQDHAFYGLDFIHSELFREEGSAAPTFAAFVSSIIESGCDPQEMDTIRARLTALGLPLYDCLSPALMDALSTHAFKSRHGSL